MRLRLTASLLLALGACGGSPSEEGDADTEVEPEERPVPRFHEPASGVLEVSVLRVEDLSVLVGSISPGLTSLEIDGRKVGTLQTRGVAGHLEPEQLTLHLGGGMIAGRHTLQLVTPGIEEPLRSSIVTIELQPEPAPRPIATELHATGLMGTAIVAAGEGDAGLLMLVDGDRAHVLSAENTGWSVDRTRTVELTGLRLGPSSSCLPSAVRVAREDEPERLRVAWRVGLPGTRIDIVEVMLEGDEPGEIMSVIELDPTLVGAVEYAALDCPTLRPRVVIAELLALADAEQSRPGDRTLVSVALLGDRLEPGLAKRLFFGEAIDFDTLGPVIDLTTPAGIGPALVGARMGGAWPVLIELDAKSGTSLLRPRSSNALVPTLGTIDRPLVTILGAFESRTIAAHDRGANRLSIAQIDDSTGSVPIVHELEDVGAPSATPGPLAGALVGGAPIFVLPMGAEHPALALTTTSPSPVVHSLDALRCDAVALPTTRAANETAEIDVACLHAGELHMATLVLE